MKTKIEPWYMALMIFNIVNIFWYYLFHYDLNSSLHFQTGSTLIYGCIVLVSLMVAYVGLKASMKPMVILGIAVSAFWSMILLWGRQIARLFSANPKVGYEIFDLLSILIPFLMLIYCKKEYIKIYARKQIFAEKKKQRYRYEIPIPQQVPASNGDKEIKKEETKVAEIVRENEKIDINWCTADELADLPGMSMATAKRMIELREQLNGFSSVDEFLIKAQIKPHFAVKIIDQLTVTAMDKPLKVKGRGRILDI